MEKVEETLITLGDYEEESKFKKRLKKYKFLKVLHICNTAGVASIIAKFMNHAEEIDVDVFQRKCLDKYGLTTYGEYLNCGAWRFGLACLLKARKYDLVHVHGFDKLLPWLGAFYPDKPKIMHYHGTRIRGRWLERRKYWKFAQKIFYSTWDLESPDMPENAVHIPNPVDTDFFHNFPECLKKPNSALTMNTSLNQKKALEYAAKHGLELTIHELGVPYREMPKLLSTFEYYIDVKTIPSGHGLSKTALEALACRLKVINWRGEIVEKLPFEHDPENVVHELHRIYEEMLYEH